MSNPSRGRLKKNPAYRELLEVLGDIQEAFGDLSGSLNEDMVRYKLADAIGDYTSIEDLATDFDKAHSTLHLYLRYVSRHPNKAATDKDIRVINGSLRKLNEVAEHLELLADVLVMVREEKDIPAPPPQQLEPLGSTEAIATQEKGPEGKPREKITKKDKLVRRHFAAGQQEVIRDLATDVREYGQIAAILLGMNIDKTHMVKFSTPPDPGNDKKWNKHLHRIDALPFDNYPLRRRLSKTWAESIKGKTHLSLPNDDEERTL